MSELDTIIDKDKIEAVLGREQDFGYFYRNINVPQISWYRWLGGNGYGEIFDIPELTEKQIEIVVQTCEKNRNDSYRVITKMYKENPTDKRLKGPLKKSLNPFYLLGDHNDMKHESYRFFSSRKSLKDFLLSLIKEDEK